MLASTVDAAAGLGLAMPVDACMIWLRGELVSSSECDPCGPLPTLSVLVNLELDLTVRGLLSLQVLRSRLRSRSRLRLTAVEHPFKRL